MKRASIAKWTDTRQRLLRVIDYIDENLDQPLTLEQLAGVAALSPFHFQRTYARFVGESPAITVRRLKLNRAAKQISSGGLSVTKAAFEAGYASPQSFSRAFSRQIGVAPSVARGAAQSKAFDAAIVTLPATKALTFDFTGIRAKAEQIYNAIYSYCQLAEILNPASQNGAVYYGDLFVPRDEPIRMELCIFGIGEVPKDAPFPLRIAEHSRGLYALTYINGPFNDFAAEHRALLGERLPAMGWRHDDSRPFLRYLVGDFALTPALHRQNFLYTPVRPLAKK